MVISLYADRRSNDIADIAGRLARAIAPLVAPAGVMLVAPGALSDEASPRTAYSANATPSASVGGSPVEVARAAILEPGARRDVGAMLQESSLRYAVTVVALSGAPNEQVLAALDAADRILLLSDPSVASLRSTQRAIKLCSALGYGLDKVAIVLHDFADDAALAPADAALALKREVLWSIPGPEVDVLERGRSYTQLAERLLQHPGRMR